jgi:hypothetical protein
MGTVIHREEFTKVVTRLCHQNRSEKNSVSRSLTMILMLSSGLKQL